MASRCTFNRLTPEGSDLYHASRRSTTQEFGEVAVLPSLVNTQDEAMPFVTANGLNLVYQVASEGRLLDSSADIDIWIATRDSLNDDFGQRQTVGDE